MARLQITPELVGARYRTFRSVWPPGPGDLVWVVNLLVTWEHGPQRAVTPEVVPSRQRLGGERWYWVCAGCGRRCGVLLTVAPDRPFACRRCWRAVYMSDYPRQQAIRALRQLLGVESGGPMDQFARLDYLMAPRRKGVRRGRRVRRRALRLYQRLGRPCIDAGRSRPPTAQAGSRSGQSGWAPNRSRRALGLPFASALGRIVPRLFLVSGWAGRLSTHS
jgi:hypothetical protein